MAGGNAVALKLIELSLEANQTSMKMSQDVFHHIDIDKLGPVEIVQDLMLIKNYPTTEILRQEVSQRILER